MKRFKQVNEEVFYATEPQTAVSGEDIVALIEQAKSNQRGRARICTHLSPDDLLHEMIIVHTKGCYVRPHRHLHRAESLQVWDGEADLIFFDEQGAIANLVKLSNANENGTLYNRISTPVFHSLIIRSPYFVFFEATQGPFNPSETEFAAWAPDQNDEAACYSYLSQLEQKLSDFKLRK